MRLATMWPDDLFEDFDRTSPLPLYLQVASRLESAVRSGALPPGSRLENELDIGKRLRLSRPTVRRAIQLLVDKGLVTRRRGIGTQVLQGPVSKSVEPTSLGEGLQSDHRGPSTQVLSYALSPASPPVREHLGLPPSSDVLALRRLRSMNGVPVAILENYLAPGYLHVTRDQLERRGLYQLLRAAGATIQITRQKIGARRARQDEARLLSIDVGGPVLTVTLVAFDDAGRGVEYGQHSYRPDLFSFETTLVVR